MWHLKKERMDGYHLIMFCANAVKNNVVQIYLRNKYLAGFNYIKKVKELSI